MALVLLVALAILASFGAEPASARSGQDPGVSTTSVAGSTQGTESGSTTSGGAGGPASTAATSTTQAATGVGSRRVADENRKIWVVVAGLIGVAVGLSLLTFRYWRQTRPVPLADPTDPTDPADPVPAADPRAPRSRPGEGGGRHSRRAVAGADHPAADDEWEPRGTGDRDRVEVPAADRRFRLTRAQRAMAYRGRRPD